MFVALAVCSVSVESRGAIVEELGRARREIQFGGLESGVSVSQPHAGSFINAVPSRIGFRTPT